MTLLANFCMSNTLATELLLLNFIGLHTALCLVISIIMHCAEFAHLTAPLVCWFIYCLCLRWTNIDVPSGQCVVTARGNVWMQLIASGAMSLSQLQLLTTQLLARHNATQPLQSWWLVAAVQMLFHVGWH